MRMASNWMVSTSRKRRNRPGIPLYDVQAHRLFERSATAIRDKVRSVAERFFGIDIMQVQSTGKIRGRGRRFRL